MLDSSQLRHRESSRECAALVAGLEIAKWVLRDFANAGLGTSGLILPPVATPLEQLTGAYEAAMNAEGQAFFRRLGEYLGLLQENRRIERVVKALSAEVQGAEQKYAEEDEELAREFVALRGNLVGRAPEAGEDADDEYPGQREPFDPAEAERWQEWSFTLANFDAIATGQKNQMIEEREGDCSRSRVLGEILNAKVYNLQYPGDPNRKVRGDLDDLRTRLNHLRDRQKAAQLRVEAVAESTGHIALLNLEHVMSHAAPREPRPEASRGSDEYTVWINEIFAEGISGFVYLRELMRPAELRGSLEPKATEAIERIEGKCKDALERLHPPLRQRLEGKRLLPAWGDFTRNEKIGIAGAALTGLSLVAAVVIALGSAA